jgi:hypothetical protein
MSESETFEAQGRAHAALKEARGRAATIKTTLTEYSRRLADLGHLVSQFAADPLQKNESSIPLSPHLQNLA